MTPSEQPRTAVYWRLSGALAVLTEWAEGEEGEGCHWCLLSEGHEGGCPVGEARAILEDEAAAPDPVASPALAIRDALRNAIFRLHRDAGRFLGRLADCEDEADRLLYLLTHDEAGTPSIDSRVLAYSLVREVAPDPVASPPEALVERIRTALPRMMKAALPGAFLQADDLALGAEAAGRILDDEARRYLASATEGETAE